MLTRINNHMNLEKYEQLTDSFAKACRDFEPFRASLEKVYPTIIEDPRMNWHTEMEAVYKTKEMYIHLLLILLRLEIL